MFWHGQGTRQDRPRRRAKPYTHEERLERMYNELTRRKASPLLDPRYVQEQEQAIERELKRQTKVSNGTK